MTEEKRTAPQKHEVQYRLYRQTRHRNPRMRRTEKQIMANNFPGLMLSINLPNPRSSMSRSMINTERAVPQYIIIKLLEVKETNHPESSKGTVTVVYGGPRIWSKADFRQEQWRPEARGWHSTPQEKTCQHSMLRKWTFSEEQSLEFAASRPALREILREWKPRSGKDWLTPNVTPTRREETVNLWGKIEECVSAFSHFFS